MATSKNFIVKNGLEVGGQEVIDSSGVVTSAALGGQTLSTTDSPTFAGLEISGSIEAPIATITQTGGATSSYAGLTVETSSTGATTQKWLNSGSELARITGNGNFGVGHTFTTDDDPALATKSNANYSYNIGNGYGDFYVGDGTYGLSIGLATGGAGAGQTRIWAQNNAVENSLQLAVGNADQISITPTYTYFTNNVGIGTTSPSAKLGINATAPDFTFLQSDVVKFRSGVSGVTNGGVTGSTSGDYFARTTGGKMLFSVDDGVTAHAIINSSGNIGIGTTTIRQRMHQHVSDSGANYHAFTNLTTGTGASDGLVVGISADEDALIWNHENKNILFATNNSEAMRIDSSGNVGIGRVSSSVVRLSVAGTDATSSNYAFEATNNLGHTRFIVRNDGQSQFFKSDTSASMTITSAGNVGIGHTSPNSKLSIVGDGGLNNYSGVLGIENTDGDPWASISLTDDIDAATGASNYYLIGRGVSLASRQMSFHIPTAADYGSGAQPKIIFASTGVDTLFSVEASTGNAYHKGTVGIGTSSPVTALDVRGEISVDYNATYGLRFYNQGRNNWSSIGNDDTSTGANLLFKDSTGTVMRITGGKVGVGTTSPAYKLDVAGNTRSEAYSSSAVLTYNVPSGTYNTGSWYDVTDRAAIANLGYGDGIYIFRVFEDTYGAGGGNYSINYLSEPFWFYNVGSNGTKVYGFRMSPVAMGHAGNSFPTNSIGLRLKENSGGVPHDIQWTPIGTNLTLDGTGGKRVVISMYKWGGQ